MTAPKPPISGWTRPPDDNASGSVAAGRSTSRRGLAWLIITLAVLGFAAVVLSYSVAG